MYRNLPTTFPRASLFSSPRILLSGDNARTAVLLGRALVEYGFHVDLAFGHRELEAVWVLRRQPIVLLEVSGPQSAEAAIETALRLKRFNPRQFVAYLADPTLQASGLAGDGVFPRVSIPLVHALRRRFRQEASVV